MGEHSAGDLNGDGDVFDEVLHVFDARTRVSINTGITTGFEFPTFALDGERLVYLLEEVPGSFEGIARVRDLRTGAEHVLGPADDLVLEDGLVSLVVPEERLGRDLDGDGVLGALVLQIHDLRTRRTFNTGVPVPLDVLFVGDTPEEANSLQDGRQIVFLVPEYVMNRDGNQDGDHADLIVFAARVP